MSLANRQLGILVQLLASGTANLAHFPHDVAGLPKRLRRQRLLQVTVGLLQLPGGHVLAMSSGLLAEDTHVFAS
jgi:hypothetical protein